MALIAQTGLLSGNTITYYVSNYSAIYLYIKYTKGDETDVTLTFGIKDSKQPVPTDVFSLSKVVSGFVVPESTVLNTNGSYLIPVPIPESADNLILTATYNGGSTGTVDVFSNIDSTND